MEKSPSKDIKSNLMDELELDEDEELRMTREKLDTKKLNQPQSAMSFMNKFSQPQQQKEEIEEEDPLDAFMLTIQKNAVPQRKFWIEPLLS